MLLLRMADSGSFQTRGTDFYCGDVAPGDVADLMGQGYIVRSKNDRNDFITMTDKARQALLLPIYLGNPKNLGEYCRNVPPDQMTVAELLHQLQVKGWKQESRGSRTASKIVPHKLKARKKVFYVEDSKAPFRSYLQSLLVADELKSPEIFHFQIDAPFDVQICILS